MIEILTATNEKLLQVRGILDAQSTSSFVMILSIFLPNCTEEEKL